MNRFFFALAAWAVLATAVRAAETKPNIVVVFTDDQTYRAIGYNNSQIRTPTLDRLAREGVVFSHAYVASPICVASRASVLTGRFPQQHGTVALNSASFVPNIERQHITTLPAALSAAGYITCLYGKSHLGDPLRFGFDTGKEYFDNFDRQPLAAATEFLNARGKDHRPFFLWFAMRQPHIPLDPEKKWLDQYTAPIELAPNFLPSPPRESIYNQGLPGEHFYRDSQVRNPYKNVPSGPPRSKEMTEDFTRAYYATISHFDSQVGQLLDGLTKAGLRDNTVMVVLSDNGYFLGNHGLGNKITMHEESVRVPMFVWGAPHSQKGTQCTELVSSLDVLPTILDLAGAKQPDGLWGKSLVPQLRDPTRPLRGYVASECVGVGGKTGQGHRMVRTQRWKYVLTDVNDEALFDEQNDPYELTNLAARVEHRETLQELRRKMKRWMEDVRDAHARPPAE